jgi:glycosyltransferase involved in cell wall biosynthesis
VASDLRGYRNVVTADVDARLAPPGDSEALAKALQAALQRGPETAEMVANGLERARDFSMERLATRYVDVYQRAVSGFSRARADG